MSWFSPVTDAALGVLGATAASAAFVRGRRLVAGARSQRRDDHQPINFGAWGVHMPPDGGSKGVRVLVICAPSRTIRGASFDPSAATRFLLRHFEPEFSPPPDFAGSQGVRFDRTDEPGSDYVWINASGRVDLSLTVPTHEAAAGRVILDVRDLLRPIARVAGTVSDPDYWRTFGSAKPPCKPRFDWRIGPSIDNRGRDMSYRVAWDDLGFPGRTPSSRAAGQRPFCPPLGFAPDKLTSRGTDEPVEELLRTFLTSFLTEQGYLDVHGAVDDVMNGWWS